MPLHHCNRCGRPILAGETRYMARLQVFAAPDTLEITAADWLQDTPAEIERWLAACARQSEAELMQDVYVERTFDLCRPCQRALLANPLAK